VHNILIILPKLSTGVVKTPKFRGQNPEVSVVKTPKFRGQNPEVWRSKFRCSVGVGFAQGDVVKTPKYVGETPIHVRRPRNHEERR